MKTYTKEEVLKLFTDELRFVNKALKQGGNLGFTDTDLSYIGTLALALKDDTYKGFTIEPESDPWAIKYGMYYRFYIDGEKIRSAGSMKEAMEQIDFITETEPIES